MEPQQATEPSVFNPQVWNNPALTEVKGGEPPPACIAWGVGVVAAAGVGVGVVAEAGVGVGVVAAAGVGVGVVAEADVGVGVVAAAGVGAGVVAAGGVATGAVVAVGVAAGVVAAADDAPFVATGVLISCAVVGEAVSPWSQAIPANSRVAIAAITMSPILRLFILFHLFYPASQTAEPDGLPQVPSEIEAL